MGKFLTLLGWLITSTLLAQSNMIPVIPQPKRVVSFDARFTLTPSTQIILGEGSGSAEEFTVQKINQDLQTASRSPLKIVKENEIKTLNNAIFLGLISKSPRAKKIADNADFTGIMALQQEGYYLQSTDSTIVIVANTSQGLFYGCMTLLQLMKKEKNKVYVNGYTIYDWPDLQFRGISDDISRGQISKLEHFKKIIAFLAKYKMNTYMLYIEDVFQFKNHPKIGQNRGALSKEDIQELQTFARSYHVQIIPIFETFGHMENILMLPEYRNLAEFPGASTLNLVSEETYSFLDELLFEITDAFSAPYLHIGGDETQQIGWGVSKALLDQFDLATIHARHYKRVYDLAKNYGKQVIMYGDMIYAHPNMLFQLPDDIIIMDWQYGDQEEYPSVEFFEKTGRKFIVSPALWNWLRIFPNYNVALANIKNLIQQGAKHGAVGAITANWNDLGGADFRDFNWYGYAFAAECAWSPETVDLNHFNQTFFSQFYGKTGHLAEVIYAYLSDLGEQILLKDIFNHPFIRQNYEKIKTGDLLKWKTRVEQVAALLDSLKKTASHNRDQLDYLEFVVDQSRWYVQKLETAALVNRFHQELFEQKNDMVNRLIGSCSSVVDSLNNLMEKLQLLWLRNYRQEGLPLLLELYGDQIDYWQEKIEQIQAGNFVMNPQLESQWIYHPDIVTDEKAQSVTHAYFRKTFDVPPGFKKVYLQAIADSYLKIYLNGGFLDEVIDARTLSLAVESQRVKMWEVTSLIKPGKNVLAVEARNYYPGQAAGLNIYCEIEYELGRTLKIVSDAYWKTSVKEEPDWQKLGFFDVQWLNAVPRERDLVITAPNFRTGRKSRIEW